MLHYARMLLRLGAGGITIRAPAGSYDNYQLAPTDAVCNVSMLSNGTCAVSSGTTPGAPSAWGSGTGFSAANYWVRWTNTSGTLTTGTVGSWISCNATNTWGVSFTGAGGSKTCTGTVEISSSSSGTPVVDSSSITLTATADV